MESVKRARTESIEAEVSVSVKPATTDLQEAEQVLDDCNGRDRLQLLQWLMREVPAVHAPIRRYGNRCRADRCSQVPATERECEEQEDRRCDDCGRAFCAGCYENECAPACNGVGCADAARTLCERCVRCETQQCSECGLRFCQKCQIAKRVCECAA